MKRKILSIILVVILMLTTTCINCYGASVSASASGGSCNVGETVTASITYTGSDFGSATVVLDYDSSYLDFVSSSGTTFASGNSFLVEATGSNSLSASFTFKSKKAGNTTITFSTPDGSTWTSEELFSCNPVYASITINSPAPAPSTTPSNSSSSSSSSSSSAGNRWDFEEENEGLPEQVEDKKEKEEPKKRPEVFEVSVGDKTYTIVETIKKEDAPKGFKLGKVKYTDWDIAAYINEDANITLVCLKDKASGEEKFFTYDETKGSFGTEIQISVDAYLEYLELKNQEPKTNWIPIIIGLITLCAVVGGGYYYYIKIYKPKKTVE